MGAMQPYSWCIFSSKSHELPSKPYKGLGIPQYFEEQTRLEFDVILYP